MTTKDEALRLALEAAAKKCDDMARSHKEDKYYWDLVAYDLAEDIRNLIGNVPLRGVK